MNKNILFFIIASLVIFADQLSKFIVRCKLPIGKEIPIINQVVSITHIRNSGAAFGLFQNGRILFIIVATVSLFIMLYFLHFFTSSIFLAVSSGLVFGGIVGNLLDRIFLGYVTDFIYFAHWPVFNIADSSLDIGISLIAIYLLFYNVHS